MDGADHLMVGLTADEASERLVKRVLTVVVMLLVVTVVGALMLGAVLADLDTAKSDRDRIIRIECSGRVPQPAECVG